MVAGRPSPYQLLLDKLHWLNHVIVEYKLHVDQDHARANEPQETKYCMPNLLYTCNVRRGMQYWFLRVHSFLLESYLRAREICKEGQPEESSQLICWIGMKEIPNIPI